jgi:hypothetical protein
MEKACDCAKENLVIIIHDSERPKRPTRPSTADLRPGNHLGRNVPFIDHPQIRWAKDLVTASSLPEVSSRARGLMGCWSIDVASLSSLAVTRGAILVHAC